MRKNGIHLIHIFEDEWLNQSDIVKSRLKNILGRIGTKYYARNGILREIPFAEASRFLHENHLQGKTQASAINIGLFIRNELVSVMSFGGLSLDKGNKQSKPGEYELKRFCSKLDITVMGAANRLMRYFEKTYNPTSVLSFANRCWTSSIKKSVYDELGFTLVGKTDPNYWYLVEPNKRTHRFTYTKGNILRKFKTANSALTEIENMRELGFDRIWDVGSLKYLKFYGVHPTPEINLQLSDCQPKTQSVARYNRKKSKETKRKISEVICEICQNTYSIVGMYTHLRLQHNITPDEYALKYLEYRPKYINEATRLAEVGDLFKCLECGERQMSNKQLVQHVNTNHGTFDDYIIKFIFDGNYPTCRCGCGEKVALKSQPPYSREYIAGHNPNGMLGKSHSAETRKKQKEKSIGRYSLGWFINRYGNVEGAKKYSERNKKLSNRNKF